MISLSRSKFNQLSLTPKRRGIFYFDHQNMFFFKFD